MTRGPGRSVGAGLCDRCRHRRMVGNRRGSLFLLCRLSAEDARYPRYPPLPVLACSGFEEGSRDPWQDLAEPEEGKPR